MKLDKQRRLKIPMALLEDVFLYCIKSSPLTLRLSIMENKLVLFYDSPDMEYHDVLSVDEKGRIILKKHILEQAGLQDLEVVSSHSQNHLQKLMFNALCVRVKVAELALALAG